MNVYIEQAELVKLTIDSASHSLQNFDMARPYLFAENVELKDQQNKLQTNGGESTLLAYLISKGKKKELSMVRFFGVLVKETGAS